MKKRIIAVLLSVVVVILLLFAGLKIYVQVEENRRAEAPGNEAIYDVSNLPENVNSILKGKKILFLGSSVTYGAAAKGQSFVEAFEKMDGVNVIKDAKSGTTLVDDTSLLALIFFGDGDSYVKRLNMQPKDLNPDCVVCQLSTNDATLNKPLGEIGKGYEINEFDTDTITGAMEYIIKYCQDRWNCPVVFYTGSYYEDNNYNSMVKRLYELKQKWNIGVIDLYTDSQFNSIDKDNYDLYMFDNIHPTKAGYFKWWMPKMEQDLVGILSAKGV